MPRAEDQPRETFLGASESGAVLGLDPYTSRFDVWARKTGRQPPRDEEAKQLRRGTLLEPIVRSVELPRRDDVHQTVDPEPEEFWLHDNGVSGSHPDGQIEMSHPTLELPGLGRLEIKTVNREVYSIVQEQGLPASNVIQLNKTIGLCGDTWGAFAVMNADAWETLLFPLMFDKTLYDFTITEERKFQHNHIGPDIAPELFPDEPIPAIPILAGDTVDAAADREWFDLMEEYQEYWETQKVLDDVWPDAKNLAKLQAAELGDDEEERELTLKERIQAKMVALEAEGVKGAGWKFLFRPGATRKQFYRELVTELGPYDPEKVAAILEEELGAIEEKLAGSIDQGLTFSPLALESIFGRLMLEARVTGEDPRFFKEIIQPYFRSFKQKGG